MQGNGEPEHPVPHHEEHLTTLERIELDPRTLRFHDELLERAFRLDYFRQNIGNLRFAGIAGVVLWVVWGLVVHGHLPPFDRPLDLTMRYAFFIPVSVAGFGLTFTRIYPRYWEPISAGALLLTMLGWVFYVSKLRTMPPDYGYVGLILMTAFGMTLLRLRFLWVMLVTGVAVVTYLPFAILAVQVAGLKTVLAIFYLLSFAMLWAVASYRSERSNRILFVRERQLDQERHHSDSLLLNILPQAIVDRLKRRETGRLAEALEEVSVLFADAVGFTEQSAKTTPDDIVAALDELFRRFDGLADRFALEKIKTVGDAYMAVAGAPVPMEGHAEAAADMALAILEESSQVRWPSGDPIVMRIGVATGPAVAGVIGHRKFAYDLWGDTVNLASRLEAYGEAGRIMVSEEVARLLEGRYSFGPPLVRDLKGKGPTPVRFLLGRVEDVRADAGSVAGAPGGTANPD